MLANFVGEHGGCPFGYSYVEQTCWKMTITGVWDINFQEATDACAADGGLLAVPKSQDMNDWFNIEVSFYDSLMLLL